MDGAIPAVTASGNSQDRPELQVVSCQVLILRAQSLLGVGVKLSIELGSANFWCVAEVRSAGLRWLCCSCRFLA